MPIRARQHACLNCVYPNLAELQQTDCDLLGVNTALVPIIAGLQVSLALHYLVDTSTVNFDQLTTVDNWQLSQQAFRVRKNPACPTCQRTDWNLEEPAIPNQIQVLCGTETYQGRLNSRPQLAAVSDWLVDRQLTVSAHASFVSFTTEDRTVSIFKNGKVLLYGLPDITAATQLFNRLQAQLNPFLEVSVS